MPTTETPDHLHSGAHLAHLARAVAAASGAGFIHRVGQHDGAQAFGALGQNAFAHRESKRLGQIVVQRVIQLAEDQQVGKNLRMLEPEPDEPEPTR